MDTIRCVERTYAFEQSSSQHAPEIWAGLCCVVYPGVPKPVLDDTMAARSNHFALIHRGSTSVLSLLFLQHNASHNSTVLVAHCCNGSCVSEQRVHCCPCTSIVWPVSACVCRVCWSMISPKKARLPTFCDVVTLLALLLESNR